jgi:dihydroorotase
MLSEDGKDVADDELFLAAMGEAKRLGVPVSCHCDLGGEVNAVRRAIELGKKAGCHIHIAHVSKKETVDIIREAKKSLAGDSGSLPATHYPLSTTHFFLTCEATPHHIGATENDARRMGGENFGRVNPSLRTDEDRLSLISALFDGTIDAVATDHAPHTEADKAAGAPGFSGLETAFAVCLSFLASPPIPHFPSPFQQLSALLSANPARILGLRDRGKIAAGLRADLAIVDIQARQKVDTAKFKSRGKCTPFADRELQGKILMTLNAGKIVFAG